MCEFAENKVGVFCGRDLGLRHVFLPGTLYIRLPSLRLERNELSPPSIWVSSQLLLLMLRRRGLFVRSGVEVLRAVRLFVQKLCSM